MKAMILAAGFGKRLLPLTSHTPKPLLTIANKPLIVYHIERLVKAGITDIIINLYHLGDQIKNYLGDGTQFGSKIIYSQEYEILETGGGIVNALPLLANEPFLVINGDIFTDYPFELLIQRAKNFNHLAHIVLVNNPPQHPHGDYYLNFTTQLISENNDPKYTFSGMSLLKPELFQHYMVEKFRLPICFASAIKQEQLTGELYQGIWHDIGTPARLAEINQIFL